MERGREGRVRSVAAPVVAVAANGATAALTIALACGFAREASAGDEHELWYRQPAKVDRKSTRLNSSH